MTTEKRGAPPHLTAAPLVEAEDHFLSFLLREQVAEDWFPTGGWRKNQYCMIFCIRSGPPSIRISINAATTNLEFLFATDDLTFGAKNAD